MSLKTQRNTFVPGKTRITYGASIFAAEERRAIEKVLDRNWWAIDGEGDAFEKELAEFVGKKYCILTNSGSSALLLAIKSLGLPGGSKVAIPAVTFPTAFSALVHSNLLPVVIDVDRQTLNLKLSDLERALKMGAKAVVSVHIAGNPVDMVSVCALAKKYGAYVVEDNCDGLGGSFNGKKLGSFGDVSCISMYAGHIINMGEGGAVLTSKKELADRVRSLRDWGRASETDARGKYPGLPSDYPSRYIYTEIGYNLRPLELQAAMGRVQLRKIKEIKKKRGENYKTLSKIFTGRPGITPLEVHKDADPCWFSYPILSDRRGELLSYLEEHNIETRPIFAGNILRQPGFRKVKVKKVSQLMESDEVMEKAFFIGLHPLIPQKAFVYIDKIVRSFFKN